MRYLLLSFIFLSLSTSANSMADIANISVSGNAVLEVEADQVVINFNANVMNKSALLAKQKTDQKVSLLVKNLKKAGFSPALLMSLSQRSTPEYEYSQDKKRLVGVRVSHELSYRLSDINKVNLFIDSVLKSNIDSISTLQYGLQDTHKWRMKVRKMAVLDSQQKSG